MRGALFAGLICALASGCASYTEGGLFGGFNETPLASDTYRIQSYGNAYTSRKKTNAIALVRAAELAAENGYDRFAILNYDEWEKTSAYTTPATATTRTNLYGTAHTYNIGPYAHTNVYGTANSTTTINPGQTYVIEKPRTDIVVKFIRADSRDAASALMVSTVLSRYGKIAGYKPSAIAEVAAPTPIAVEEPAIAERIAVPVTNASTSQRTFAGQRPAPRRERSIQQTYESLSPEEKDKVDTMAPEERAAYLYDRRFY